MPRTNTPEIDAQAYAMRIAGSTVAQIRDALGFNNTQAAYHAVTRHATANQLADPARRRSQREAARYARRAGLAFDPEQFAAVQATSVVTEAGGAFISARTFGCEIEFTRSGRGTINRASVATIRDALIAEGIAVHDGGEHFYSHTVLPVWKIVYDASTDLEVVSPVLSGIDGLRQVRTVMSVLRRFGTATARDGAHVHVYAGDLTPMTIYRIVEFYTLRQTAIDSLHPASRRNGRWAQSFTPSQLRSVRRYAENGQVHAVFGRYATVNLECYNRQQTIEFRQAAGTLIGRKSNDWVEFLLGFVSAVEQNAHADCPLDLHGMLDWLVAGRYVKRATARRLEARAASFGFNRPDDHTPTAAPVIDEPPAVFTGGPNVPTAEQISDDDDVSSVYGDACEQCRLVVREAFATRDPHRVLAVTHEDGDALRMTDPVYVRASITLDELRPLDVPGYVYNELAAQLAPAF